MREAEAHGVHEPREALDDASSHDVSEGVSARGR